MCALGAKEPRERGGATGGQYVKWRAGSKGIECLNGLIIIRYNVRVSGLRVFVSALLLARAELFFISNA